MENLVRESCFFLPGKHPLFFSQKIAIRKKIRPEVAARRHTVTSAI